MTLVASLILVWIIVEDFRRYRIRNVWVLALVAAFVADCALRGRLALLLPHGLLALLGFCILSVSFALRMIGGGDVKLLSAALLWVGPEGCVVFALTLLLSTAVYVTGAWAGLLPARHHNGRRVIPYGPSVAAALIIYNAVVTFSGS